MARSDDSRATPRKKSARAVVRRVSSRLGEVVERLKLGAARRVRGLPGRSRVRRRTPAWSRSLDGLEVVFTVTSGRSGTHFLSDVADVLHDVEAHHEPQPHFQDLMRAVQEPGGHALAVRWLRDVKIPAISRAEAPTYLEASHVFCKGFLEPWIEVVGPPTLIVWTRAASSIAKSLHQIGATPWRTEIGRKWYLSPTDPGVLPILSPETLSDYQVGYWYALEIERRQREDAARVERLGGRVFHSGIEPLNTLEGFRALTRFLRGREPDVIEERLYTTLAGQPVNTKAHRKHNQARTLPEDRAEQEADVHARILAAR